MILSSKSNTLSLCFPNATLRSHKCRHWVTCIAWHHFPLTYSKLTTHQSMCDFILYTLILKFWKGWRHSLWVEKVQLWIYKLRQLVAFTPYLQISLFITKKSDVDENPCASPPSLLFHQDTATSFHVLLPFLRVPKILDLTNKVSPPLGARRAYNRRRLCSKVLSSYSNYPTSIFEKNDWLSS